MLITLTVHHWVIQAGHWRARARDQILWSLPFDLISALGQACSGCVIGFNLKGFPTNIFYIQNKLVNKANRVNFALTHRAGLFLVALHPPATGGRITKRKHSKLFFLFSSVCPENTGVLLLISIRLAVSRLFSHFWCVLSYAQRCGLFMYLVGYRWWFRYPSWL